MATNTINENVEQAILDFGTIKQAIVNKGVSVPSGTPTSQYGNKISSIPTGADVSNVTATAGDVDTGKVFVDSTGTEVTGQSTYKADYTALNTLVSGTTATQADVDSGKLFVKSDGTQGTGSSTYKADYTALNTLVGQTTAVAEDVAQGKLFVNASGVQTTGTASGGGNEDFITVLERPLNANITIPNGTTKLGIDVFNNWSGLTSINLPDTLTEIKARAFYYCDNLGGTITLPPGLITLGNNAFSYSHINIITFLGTPSTISTTAFASCSYLATIKVPWSASTVAGAPWGAVDATIIYNYTP